MVVGGCMKVVPCMMDDRDGIGDGDGGNEMCVIGTPVDGGRGGCDTGAAVVAEVAATVEMGSIGCWTCGAERYPEMVGLGASNSKIPP